MKNGSRESRGEKEKRGFSNAEGKYPGLDTAKLTTSSHDSASVLSLAVSTFIERDSHKDSGHVPKFDVCNKALVTRRSGEKMNFKIARESTGR